MKKLLLVFAFGAFANLNAQFTIFQENFDIAPDFLGNGWTTSNLSNPLGANDWTQGNGTDVGEIAFNGDTTEYVTTNYLATDGAGSGTISDWLISPVITFNNGDTVSFYTISYNSHTYPDRLELRLSTSGASTNIGATESSTGDFTVNLVTVNPLLDTTSYPSVAVQGDTWVQFYGVVSGLGGPTAGRIALRYYVTDGGGTGANSSTIAVDAVRVSSTFPAGLETELSASVNVYPNPASDYINVTIAQPLDGMIFVYDMNGKTMLTQSCSMQNTSVDMSSLAAGNYLVKIAENNTGRYTMKSIVKK